MTRLGRIEKSIGIKVDLRASFGERKMSGGGKQKACQWRGMDLNHQPRAYEAYSCLIHLSIPKTRLIAFSFGRAGLNPLDFSEGACQRLCPRLNSVPYCKQITQFGKRLSSKVSWSGLQIESPLHPLAESGTTATHQCAIFSADYYHLAGFILVGPLEVAN